MDDDVLVGRSLEDVAVAVAQEAGHRRAYGFADPATAR